MYDLRRLDLVCLRPVRQLEVHLQAVISYVGEVGRALARLVKVCIYAYLMFVQRRPDIEDVAVSYPS